MWIGIDDTDSIKGGCTTYIAIEMISNLSDQYDLIGYPHLVRLNPNIPWKTRGNGAVSFQIGQGCSTTTIIGEKQGKKIVSHQTMKKDLDTTDHKNIQKVLQNIIETYGELNEATTNPGYVIMKHQPETTMYTQAVTSIVPLKTTQQFLDAHQATYKGYNNKRGLIGAVAATAWSAQNDHTYELIAYRKKTQWGTPRNVDDNSVQTMDSTCVSTFDNYDYTNHHTRIVPHSPCPILYGIRGENMKELLIASSKINAEPIEGWILFCTNQGTDDHLQKKTISNVQPYESVIIQGIIVKSPTTIQGGHVIFTLQDETGTIDAAAYEPTKEFRTIIRELQIDDKIEISGGVREHPLTINIEKIRILHLTTIHEKTENPRCPTCGKHMKSRGTNQGYKCIRCGQKTKHAVLKEKKRSITNGYYEVPVCARRHLSKPLKRMKTLSTEA